MIASFISLASIFIGIIGANITGIIFKKYSFGLTGNTIIGVFGSVFLVKLLGRFGLDPKLIIQSEIINYSLLTLNFFFSFLSGAITVFFSFKLKKIITKNNGE
ncbi:MAG: hypothetical protein ABJK28_14765 [Algibacter sp.]